MVQFGATLKAQRNKDWQEYYIDYHVSLRFDLISTTGIVARA